MRLENAATNRRGLPLSAANADADPIARAVHFAHNKFKNPFFEHVNRASPDN